MTQGVVDLLEAVEVDQQHRDRTAVGQLLVEPFVKERPIREVGERIVGRQCDRPVELVFAVALQDREQHQHGHEEQEAGGRLRRDERDHVANREQQHVDQIRELERGRERPRRHPEPVAVQEPGRGRVERELRDRGNHVDRPVREMRRVGARDEEHQRRSERVDGRSDHDRETLASTSIAHARDHRRRQPPCDRHDRNELRGNQEQARDEHRRGRQDGARPDLELDRRRDGQGRDAREQRSGAHSRRRRHDQPRADTDHVERGEGRVGIRASEHVGAARDPASGVVDGADFLDRDAQNCRAGGYGRPPRVARRASRTAIAT